ncbi:hydroxyglutarate oxidase [Vibrio cholerae]|nr:hydroxyglutarate oxidase [Vibrio cholerae]
MTYDYVIVGGGIVGVSTGWQLKRRYPEKSVLLIEKEAGVFPAIKPVTTAE